MPWIARFGQNLGSYGGPWSHLLKVQQGRCFTTNSNRGNERTTSSQYKPIIDAFNQEFLWKNGPFMTD